MSNNYQILIQKLDDFIRKYYKNRLLKGVIYSLALILCLFIFTALLEFFAQFNTFGRTVLFYAFFVVAAYVLALYIISPLFKLYKLGSVINHHQAAQIIGNHFAEVKDKLINVLQLQEMVSTQDNQLVLAGIDQKSIALKPVPFTDAVNLKENVKHLKFALIPLFILLLISIVSPDILKVSTSRIIHHNQEILPLAPFQLTIQNKTLEVLKNKDFELIIALEGKQIPHKIFLNKAGVKVPFSKLNATTFSYTFKNVQVAQSFSIYASGFDSKKYVLNVLPNPILTQFKVKLDYPTYLEKTNEWVENVGDLIVPQGTKLRWEISVEDADRFYFNLNDTSMALVPDDGVVSFSFTAQKSTPYSFLPANQPRFFGDTIRYSLQVIPDQYPTIQVSEKQDSLNEKRYYFKGLIEDDYGFSKLTFNYQILTKIDSLPNRNQPHHVTMPFNKVASADEFFHFWNMETVNVLPGDEVSYYFEVWDNDGIHGRKSTKSHIRTYKLKTIAERNDKTNQANQNIKDQLAESISEAKELQKDVENLRKKLSEKKDVDWEEKKKIKEMLEKQKELEKKLEALNLENQNNNAQQNEYKKYNEDILKKQEQLQKLFDELMTDEMKELMKKLEEMMEKLDKNLLENELEKMDVSNNDLEKELDRSLELFKQMEFEQKLDEAKNKMKELAEKEKKLAEKTQNKEEGSEQLKKEQEDIQKDFEALTDELKELKKKDEELERPKGFDEMKEQQKEASEEMNKSSDQLQNKKNKKAAEAQNKAGQKMEEMAQQMASMQSASSGEGEDMDALRQLLDNLLHLSFEQEALMEKFKVIKRESPEYVKMAQQQNKLQQDAKMIEDSLLTKKLVPLILT